MQVPTEKHRGHKAVRSQHNEGALQPPAVLLKYKETALRILISVLE